MANNINEEGTPFKRCIFPRKAKERTAMNLEKLAVIMEVFEACNAVEDPVPDEEFKHSKKRMKHKKTNKNLLLLKRNETENENYNSTKHYENKDQTILAQENKHKSKELSTQPTNISGLSHFMDLEERTDLLNTSPMDDPLGPDSFDNFQWVDVKQEITDDVEVSKVILTDLPLNICQENAKEISLNETPTVEAILREKSPDTKQTPGPKSINGESFEQNSLCNEEKDAQPPLILEGNGKEGYCSEDGKSVYSDGDQISTLDESSSDVQESENNDVNLDKKKRKTNPQTCDLCGKKLSSKGSLRVHKLKKHKQKTQFICELCGVKFEFHREAVQHRNSVHRKEDGRFSCEICCRRYSDYHTFLTHTRSHLHHNKEDNKLNEKNKTTLHGDDEGMKSNYLDEELRDKLKHQEKNFVCHTCGKRFAFNCLLRDHINLHTGTKPYLCQQCGKAFSQKATLKQHAKTHNDIRPFQCSECPLGFYGRGDLKKHIRKHTGERPYVCEVCGDGFSRSSHLGVHRRSHTGERPYMCDVCGRGFTKRGDVVRHRRIHTGELPYLCQVCGKAFRQSTQCANHIKSQHPDAPVMVARNPNPIHQRLQSHAFC